MSKPKMTQRISDQGSPSKYFHIILNMADDDLDPYQYRLLGHYRRVCGDGGECFEATTTTAAITRMSVGKVVAARRQLEKMGYITIEKRCAQATLIVRLVDRMAENCQRYAKPAFTTRTERSPHERSVHHMNADLPVQRSCGEPKKKEEEPIEEDALAAAADRDTDPKRGAVFTLYEQNIGALTPLIVDAINMWLAEPQFKTTGEDRASHALETAIREAAASNVRRWTYIHAILKRMARDEIDSPRRPAPANGAPPPTTPSAPPSSPTPRIVIPPPIPLAERQMMAERTRVARLAMGMGGKDAGSEIGNGGNDK